MSWTGAFFLELLQQESGGAGGPGRQKIRTLRRLQN